MRTNFGTVNLIAQTAANRVVLEHSKFGFNPLASIESTKVRCTALVIKARTNERGALLYGSLSGEAYALYAIDQMRP